MRVPPSQASVALLAMAWLLVGCESPTRVRPWQHAPDPVEAARASAPRSTALVPEREGEAVRTARGHTLRVHLDAELPRLHPLLAPTVASRRILNGVVFEPLLAYVPGDDDKSPGRYAPRLARSWRVSPNGLELRIELEPAVFHDGHQMSSIDVQFTLDLVRDGRRGIDHLRGMLAEIEAVELVTAREVRVRLRHASGWVLRALAEIPILPMHVYGESLAAGGAIVGTGPYRLLSHKGAVVHLGRFAKYWGPSPAISDIELVHEPDAARALLWAKRGELDVVPSLIATHWPEQATAPGLASAFSPIELAPPRLRYLVFNVASPPLDDVRVRRALALLVDRRDIAKSVYDGLARPALWPVWPGGPAIGPTGLVPELDPAAAGKLLEAAGFVDRDGDGVRELAGRPLRLSFLRTERPAARNGEPPPPTEADRFLAAARRAGIGIDQRVGTEAVLEKRLADGEFQIAIAEWRGMADTDLRELVGTGGTFNYGRYSSAAMDRVLGALAAAWGPQERAALADELVAVFEAEVPIAGIVAAAPQGLVHRRIAGLRAWDGWFDVRPLQLQ